jgi:hypothetical protein
MLSKLCFHVRHKTLLCSLLAVCALMMALTSSALAGGIRPTTPRADEYISVSCQEPPVLFTRSDVNSLGGQERAQYVYNLKHEETCFVD